MRNAGVRQWAFPLLVGVLLVSAEIAVIHASVDDAVAARYLLPCAWTLPLLLRDRVPAVAVLTVMSALLVESYVAQSATESITALPAVMLAFWIAGTIDDETQSIAVGMVAFGLAVVVVARNPGAFQTGDAVFLAIAAGAPFAAGTTVRARERRTREVTRRADELERAREAEARAAVDAERT